MRCASVSTRYRALCEWRGVVVAYNGSWPRPIHEPLSRATLHVYKRIAWRTYRPHGGTNSWVDMSTER